MKHLSDIINKFDTELVELLMGMVTFGIGLYFVAIPQKFSLVRHLMWTDNFLSCRFVGMGMMILGAMSIMAIARDDLVQREWLAAIRFVQWIAFHAFTQLGDLITPTYLLYAAASGWVYIRLSLERKAIEQRSDRTNGEVQNSI